MIENMGDFIKTVLQWAYFQIWYKTSKLTKDLKNWLCKKIERNLNSSAVKKKKKAKISKKQWGKYF